MSTHPNRLAKTRARFELAPITLTRLAIYRLWICAIVLVDVLIRARDYLQPAGAESPFYILRLLPIHPCLLNLIYVVLIIFVLLAFIGFKTNFAVLFAGIIYLIYKITPGLTFVGADHLLLPLMFSMIVLAFSPSGARLSVDDLLKRLRENHAAQQFIPKTENRDQSPNATWPLRSMQAAMILLYFLAALFGLAWNSRGFLEWFGLACPLFLDFQKIARWIRRHITAPNGLTKFAILFDGQCPLCIRSVTIVDFFDWRGKFSYRDVNDWTPISRDYPNLDQRKSLEEMQLMIPRNGRDETLAGFYAFRKIAQHLPPGMLIWPFLYLPGVPLVGTRWYRFVASRRKRMTGGERCGFHACEIAAPAKINL
ncbi:MAG: DCC1-like thiol-disulfide oxidoreductase family protein [candidate division KSB1 bacterium]|nr:DCC1-like thiol-disulfide oxidoreductase family protein [candidate division KSB1 bacterium]MDZ7407021.1 DCC1-like thiol-disulfide oxidoreductase family protein [candidate division KSB1 bacterium]